MAIYHLSVKTISRSAGRSATAAAAYRAGVEIGDERTGEIHDYTRKGGVESAELVLPSGSPEWATDRAALWNAAEQAETRKNSTVAREFEIALPDELSPIDRIRLARDFAREIVVRHGCAADVAIHAPGKEGDTRNHHAHVLLTTRRLTPEGLGEKTRELDDRKTGPLIVTQWRERFACLQNERLRECGLDARVDHRSLKDQGIQRLPTKHLGPAATGFERRRGHASRRRQDLEEEATKRLRDARDAGIAERALAEAKSSILDLTNDLAAARSAVESHHREWREREASRLSEVASLREKVDRISHYLELTKSSSYELRLDVQKQVDFERTSCQQVDTYGFPVEDDRVRKAREKLDDLRLAEPRGLFAAMQHTKWRDQVSAQMVKIEKIREEVVNVENERWVRRGNDIFSQRSDAVRQQMDVAEQELKKTWNRLVELDPRQTPPRGGEHLCEVPDSHIVRDWEARRAVDFPEEMQNNSHIRNESVRGLDDKEHSHERIMSHLKR